MIVVNTETVPGHEVAEALGVVRGSTIRAKHIGRDIMASLRNLAGGEVYEYTKLMAEVREQAVDRMVADARALGANGVLAIRFQSAEVSKGAAEMMCYGTAVELSEEG